MGFNRYIVLSLVERFVEGQTFFRRTIVRRYDGWQLDGLGFR